MPYFFVGPTAVLTSPARNCLSDRFNFSVQIARFGSGSTIRTLRPVGAAGH
jgi:hypothetical protein